MHLSKDKITAHYPRLNDCDFCLHLKLHCNNEYILDDCKQQAIRVSTRESRQLIIQAMTQGSQLISVPYMTGLA